MKVHIQYNIATDEMDFYIVEVRDGRNDAFAKVGDDGVLIFTTRETGHFDVKPSFSLPHHATKILLDSLIGVGVKPTEQSKIEGLYEASQKHLQDMRDIVFKVKK